MNEIGRHLVRLIGNVLKPSGFRNQGNTWVLKTDECVCAVNIQKSEWSNSFYLNVSVSPAGLIGDRIPPYYDFDISVRATQLTGCERLDEALNFQNGTSSISDEAALSIEHCLRDHVLPFISSLTTVKELREFLKGSLASRVAVRARLRDYLGSHQEGSP